MKVKPINNGTKASGKPVNRCLAANLSPPENSTVKELKICLRCPELFLAGCTSAEPVSASFRQNKYIMNNINNKIINAVETQCG
ncbi:MAG: hypothetical protein WKF97_20070 [Chitinophagaceae bacterium]